MKYLKYLCLFAASLLAGCASNPMLVTKNQTIEKASPVEAQVVFMRSSFVGSAINASLYDVTSGEPEFIGIIANATKLAYKTTPGKHIFMVVSEAADFMEADLLAGKTYYGLVTPRMGFWKARFSLWPIKSDPSAEFSTQSSDFKSWIQETQLALNSEKSLAWFNKNKNSVIEKYHEYWAVWQQKPLNEVAQRTLLPQDGM